MLTLRFCSAVILCLTSLTSFACFCLSLIPACFIELVKSLTKSQFSFAQFPSIKLSNESQLFASGSDWESSKLFSSGLLLFDLPCQSKGLFKSLQHHDLEHHLALSLLLVHSIHDDAEKNHGFDYMEFSVGKFFARYTSEWCTECCVISDPHKNPMKLP